MKDKIEKISADLSAFIKGTSITRNDTTARIIVDYQNIIYPIHLLGFTAPASNNDFEIYESGFKHLNNLIKEIEAAKKNGSIN